MAQKSKGGLLTLNIDPGNGWIKFITAEGRRCCIPSYIKVLGSREKGTPDKKSVLLNFDGDRYSVGQVAGQLGGKQLYAMGKAEYGFVAVAAAIALGTPPTDKPIKLRVLVPDSDRDEWVKFGDTLAQKLERFVSGSGSDEQLYFPDIADVELISEGLPVWRFVRDRNLVPAEYDRKMIGVLDAGTGDLTATLFTETGEIVREANASFTVPSMKALVGTLASELEVAVPGSSPDRSTLMESIKSGWFTYETPAGAIDFSSQWETILKRWRKDLMGTLQRDRWAEYWAKLGMVFIVGGASPLLKPIEKATGGRFKVLEVDGIDHQVINAYLLSLL